VDGTEQPHHNDYVYALKDEEAYLQADDKKHGIVLEHASIACQFCGKFSEQIAGGLFQAKHLVRDPNTSALATVWICDECVARMAQILAEDPPELSGCEAGRSGHVAAVPPPCPNHRSAAVIHGQPRSMPVSSDL